VLRLNSERKTIADIVKRLQSDYKEKAKRLISQCEARAKATQENAKRAQRDHELKADRLQSNCTANTTKMQKRLESESEVKANAK
jgi:hypothetical protein